MTTSQIDGGRQIKNGTIVDAQIAAGAAIALSKLAEAVIQADGGQAFTANQSMGGFELTNLAATPTTANSATPRDWVLSQIAGVSTTGHTVRLATTAAGTLATSFENGDSIDGFALATGDRILIKNQASAAENGVYVVNASGAPTRATDFDSWAEVPGSFVSVQIGTANADTLWLSTADAGGTLGSTSITFTQIPGPSDILAGAGLLRTGQTIAVQAANGSITVGADDIAVTFATPNLTLGTSNAAGSAASSIRSDATILVFDATNPAASAPGDTVVVGSATVAARRDHRHARETWVVREIPTGSINGSNTTFTLANTPTAGTEEVYLNGLLQHPGAGNDYTISGATITYLAAPLTGDRLVVAYRF